MRGTPMKWPRGWLRRCGVAPGEDRLPCQTNAVFAELPQPVIDALWQKGWRFYTHVRPGQCRFMCSWDTTPEDVNDFAAEIKALLQKLPA